MTVTRKNLVIAFFVILIAVPGTILVYKKINQRPPLETKFAQVVRDSDKSQEESDQEVVSEVEVKKPGNYALIENPTHVYQTFNNCGPATLSMILSWHETNVHQSELGRQMRPFQNLQGDNDDKTIFTHEFVEWARVYGFESIARVNGDIELLKTLTANGIPVVVKTWLNVDDDIGHFRLVRGFDDERKIIIQDDSYHGPNKRIPYFDFLSMWQPFNYDYILVYTPQQAELVEAIIGLEMDENVSWQNALTRAQNEIELDPINPYPHFNAATAHYHLGNYQSSVEEFEKVRNDLPGRMLWYQIEPILAYRELGNYDRVFEIINNILENGNRAFSELYLIRGEIFLAQGRTEDARSEFEKALLYNENYQAAKDALKLLD